MKREMELVKRIGCFARREQTNSVCMCVRVSSKFALRNVGKGCACSSGKKARPDSGVYVDAASALREQLYVSKHCFKIFVIHLSY